MTITRDSDDLSEAALPERDVCGAASSSTVMSLLETNLYRKVRPGWKSTVKNTRGLLSSLFWPDGGLHPARKVKAAVANIISEAFNMVPFVPVCRRQMAMRYN